MPFNISGNADYTAVTRTITFPASDSSFTVSVPITDDNLFELDEFFTARISETVDNPSVDILPPGDETTVQITNDDSKFSSSKSSIVGA